jgi:hypothetical protein
VCWQAAKKAKAKMAREAAAGATAADGQAGSEERECRLGGKDDAESKHLKAGSLEGLPEPGPQEKEEEEEEECCICFKDLVTDVLTTPCGHRYHG